MLFLISLVIGLVLGCLIGGMVLLLARSLSTSRPEPLDVPHRTAQQSTQPHWI